MDYRFVYRNKKLINITLILLLVMSVAITIVFLFSGYDVTMMFSTLFFILLLAIMSNIKESIARGDFITIYIILLMALRYIPYPILFCILKADSFYLEEYSYAASLLFVLEEIFVLFVVNYALRRIRWDDTLYNDYWCGNRNNSTRNKSWLIVILLLLSSAVYIAFPAVSSNYQFIWSVNIASAAGTDFSSMLESLGYVVIDSTRLLVPLVIVNKCYEINIKKKSPSNLMIILSFVACLFPMLLIKNMNRGSSFFTSLIYIWLVIKLYGWKRCKKYAFAVLSGVVLLLAAVSAVKHAMGLSNEGFSLPYIYKMLQAYTLGLETIRVGLKTNSVYSGLNGFYVLFNDVFSSVPILNRFADSSLRYTSLFNSVYYTGLYNKNDALAPLFTNMLYVFGPIGFFVPLYMVSKAIKSYFKALQSNSINKVFVLVYLGVVLEAGCVGSLSATVATLIWVVFPLFVFVGILDRVRFK